MSNSVNQFNNGLASTARLPELTELVRKQLEGSIQIIDHLNEQGYSVKILLKSIGDEVNAIDNSKALRTYN